MSDLSDPSGAFLFEHVEISRKALSVSEKDDASLFSSCVKFAYARLMSNRVQYLRELSCMAGLGYRIQIRKTVNR